MKTLSENETTTFTVLCVDDEVNILKAIKRVLHRQDFKLITAESGAQDSQTRNRSGYCFRHENAKYVRRRVFAEKY